MSDASARQSQARREAADWMARLNSRVVQTEIVEQFFDWRRDPLHQQAYAELEQVWAESGKLDRDPAIRDALEQAIRPRSRGGFSMSSPITWGACIAMMLLLVVSAGMWWQFPRPVTTAKGEQRRLVLADGSRLWINTDSQVRLAVSSDHREITVDHGEAYVEVAHDPAHPFQVKAGDITVRALGTHFDVRHENEQTDVLLAEGSVRVSAGDRVAATLAPGQAIRLQGNRTSSLGEVDMARLLSWMNGRIHFEATPLETAVAEVNRYTDKGIDLAPDVPGRIEVSGTFDTGNTQDFLTAVTALFPLVARPQANGRVRLEPRS